MDKEKEIEEIARVLAANGCGAYEICKRNNDLTCSNEHCEDCAGRTLGPMARGLYDAGYRLCGGEGCKNFKHYEAECTRCTNKMELKQQLSKNSLILAEIENYIDGLRYYLDEGYTIHSCYSNEEEVVVNLVKEACEEKICCMSLGESCKGGKTIAELAKEVHENAKAHGWWDNLRREGELLMLIVSEVSEAFEEVRNGRGMKETYYSAGGKMEGVPSELADVVIRVMDICEYYGIDLEAAIAEKHAFNVTRPFKHGGKKL